MDLGKINNSREIAFLVKSMAFTGPAFFLQIASKGASYDTKISCIQLLWAGAKIYKFSFLQCAGPLRSGVGLAYTSSWFVCTNKHIFLILS